MPTLNATLTLSDWFNLRNLDGGMYGTQPGHPRSPENPALSMVVPRVVTLGTGQVIYRWVDSRASGTPLEKAAGPWWSTKRGAQAILRAATGSDTSGAARNFSNIARSWGSDLSEVICARVTQPIRCILGVGRAIYDSMHREVLDGRGLQLYIPNLSEKAERGSWTLSAEARAHLSIIWTKPSKQLTADDLVWGDDPIG